MRGCSLRGHQTDLCPEDIRRIPSPNLLLAHPSGNLVMLVRFAAIAVTLCTLGGAVAADTL